MKSKSTITTATTAKYISPKTRIISIESEGEILSISGDDGSNDNIDNVTNGVGINDWKDGNDNWFSSEMSASSIWK